MMDNAEQSRRPSSLGDQGEQIHEGKLKALLEPEHNGQAVAIHVDSEDYALGDTHSAAARALLERHTAPDGRIVTLTIGPPTEADRRLAYRVLAGQKR